MNTFFFLLLLRQLAGKYVYACFTYFFFLMSYNNDIKNKLVRVNINFVRVRKEITAIYLSYNNSINPFGYYYNKYIDDVSY